MKNAAFRAAFFCKETLPIERRTPEGGPEAVPALMASFGFALLAQFFHHGLDEGFGAFHAAENRL